MEKDIRNLRKALTILAASVDEPDYQKQLKRNLFPYGPAGIAIMPADCGSLAGMENPENM